MCDDFVPFGKYRGRSRGELLSDRGYCEWLSQQPWFEEKYPDLHHAVMCARSDPNHEFINREGVDEVDPYYLGQLDAQRLVPVLPLYDDPVAAAEYVAGWNVADTGKPAPHVLRRRPRRRWFRW